jgi:glycine/D-amino acid oxidase-like deaminating enzyme
MTNGDVVIVGGGIVGMATAYTSRRAVFPAWSLSARGQAT